ncbi:DUF4340 domain-containing protein [Thermodesulfobacteriota bacterium]
MKLKKEYLILTAVMVALILYLALHRSNRTHYTLPEISSIPDKHISKIALEKADGTVVLNKKDNAWYIGPKEYPADSDKIQNILNVIENLKVTALVSESKNYVRYDLNPDKKIHVKAWQGKSLIREFDIGKSAATYQHTFVKLAEDPNVYHARGDFRQKFDPTVEDLRDRTVLSFVQKDLREIKITRDKKAVALDLKLVVKADGEKKDAAAETGKSPESQTPWVDANGKKVDAVNVGRLLGFLNRLECEAYLDDSKKDVLKAPVYAVTLQGPREYSLSIFAKENKDEKTYPAVSSENDYPFLLSDTQIDSLKANIDEIKKVKEK